MEDGPLNLSPRAAHGIYTQARPHDVFFTAATITERFGNEEEADGKTPRRLDVLFRELLYERLNVHDIPSLTVTNFKGRLWVVNGNRRLYVYRYLELAHQLAQRTQTIKVGVMVVTAKPDEFERIYENDFRGYQVPVRRQFKDNSIGEPPLWIKFNEILRIWLQETCRPPVYLMPVYASNPPSVYSKNSETNKPRICIYPFQIQQNAQIVQRGEYMGCTPSLVNAFSVPNENQKSFADFQQTQARGVMNYVVPVSENFQIQEITSLPAQACDFSQQLQQQKQPLQQQQPPLSHISQDSIFDHISVEYQDSLFNESSNPGADQNDRGQGMGSENDDYLKPSAQNNNYYSRVLNSKDAEYGNTSSPNSSPLPYSMADNVSPSSVVQPSTVLSGIESNYDGFYVPQMNVMPCAVSPVLQPNGMTVISPDNSVIPMQICPVFHAANSALQSHQIAAVNAYNGFIPGQYVGGFCPIMPSPLMANQTMPNPLMHRTLSAVMPYSSMPSPIMPERTSTYMPQAHNVMSLNPNAVKFFPTRNFHIQTKTCPSAMDTLDRINTVHVSSNKAQYYSKYGPNSPNSTTSLVVDSGLSSSGQPSPEGNSGNEWESSGSV